MSYQETAEILTVDHVVGLLRALDAIAHTPTDVRPGHPEFITKSALIELAQSAMKALPTFSDDFDQ